MDLYVIRGNDLLYLNGYVATVLKVRRIKNGELQVRGCALARLLGLGLAGVVANVQKHGRLQDLQRVHGSRHVDGVAKRRSRLVLQQPGPEVKRDSIRN